ncbi:hypothetical protein C8J57DRAFT_1211427 [Mycena rebaudengoi]|nr:hypothetical protein C8J57DRAFT_1211427 [Mycena rebaudengoi]
MRLPQELFDLIIDHVAAAERRKALGFRPNGTTRTCALVSRAFARRSQTHLFASIFCGNINQAERLNRLLYDSPHLGALYVRSIALTLKDRDSAIGGVPQLLPYLTNLTRLLLWSDPSFVPHQWSAHSAAAKSAILGTLALPSLRALSLFNYKFENVVELETVLGHATSVKELSLNYITLADTSCGSRPITGTPPVVLDSLKIYGMDPEVTHALLSSFRAVDITRLRSLDATGANLRALLAANADTVQEVRCSLIDHKPLAPEVLAGNTTLRAIHLQGPFPHGAVMLAYFGDLRCLQALETVVLCFTTQVGRADDPRWAALDALLGQAGAALRAVVIRAFVDKPLPDAAVVRRWLPQVNAEIFVLGLE